MTDRAGEIRSCKIIEVIETVVLRGDGKNTIAREVRSYHRPDGTLIHIEDGCPNGIPPENSDMTREIRQHYYPRTPHNKIRD